MEERKTLAAMVAVMDGFLMACSINYLLSIETARNMPGVWAMAIVSFMVFIAAMSYLITPVKTALGQTWERFCHRWINQFFEWINPLKTDDD